MPFLAMANISNVDLSVGTSSSKKNFRVYDRNNRHTQTISDVNGTKKFYDKNQRVKTLQMRAQEIRNFLIARNSNVGNKSGNRY